MHSIDMAAAWTPEQLWGWHSARRSVSDALAALDEVGAALLPLIADTEWQAEGVRALHVEIESFSAQCASAAATLRARLWELEAAA
ncbi:hypothetical protein [Microbacterium sp. CIAB417]|uniref:hypothetical protein n=1 Tax=Microbacterium sp. CIAB417 TaxID=2860287 RepID=UPI001FADE01A|nr:hypothetical protein [Microbacterium sp. CIAB417]